MALEEITHYTCVWDLDDHKGYIGLFQQDEFIGGANYSDPMEYMAVLGMLRSEKPVYFDLENQWLMAGISKSGQSLTPVGRE